MLYVFSEKQKGFFVMVNADSETADYGRLNQLMIEALEVKPFPETAPNLIMKTGDLKQYLCCFVRAPSHTAQIW